jgi:hypothetical protein
VRVPVTVGLDDDTNAEIVKGDLRAGDRVIVSDQGGAASPRQGQQSAPRMRF